MSDEQMDGLPLISQAEQECLKKKWAQIFNGTPQGFVFIPLLFSLYINFTGINMQRNNTLLFTLYCFLLNLGNAI